MARVPQTTRRFKPAIPVSTSFKPMRSISAQGTVSPTPSFPKPIDMRREELQPMKALERFSSEHSRAEDSFRDRKRLSLRSILATLGLSGLAAYLMTDEAKAEAEPNQYSDVAEELFNISERAVSRIMREGYASEYTDLMSEGYSKKKLKKELQDEKFSMDKCVKEATGFDDSYGAEMDRNNGVHRCISRVGEILARQAYLDNRDTEFDGKISFPDSFPGGRERWLTPKNTREFDRIVRETYEAVKDESERRHTSRQQ